MAPPEAAAATTAPAAIPAVDVFPAWCWVCLVIAGADVDVVLIELVLLRIELTSIEMAGLIWLIIVLTGLDGLEYSRDNGTWITALRLETAPLGM
jgi:hypothetical protein